jgi:hypothetical protein
MSEQRVWWIGYGDDSYREFHTATLEWVTSLGTDPNWLAPEAEVVERDGVFEFHAEQLVRDESGKPQYDPDNPDSLLTTPVAIPVTEGSWPARPAEANV